jgi:hypothetical protein
MQNCHHDKNSFRFKMGGNGSRESPADKSRRQAMDRTKANVLAEIDRNVASGRCVASFYFSPIDLEPPREWIEELGYTLVVEEKEELGYTLVVEEKDRDRRWTISWKEPSQRAAWEKEPLQ